MKQRIMFLFALCFIFSSGVLHSQDGKYVSYGLYGSFNLNETGYDLRQLQGVNDTIPRYANGSSNGFSLGALYEQPLSQKLSLMIRAGYTKYEATINGPVPITEFQTDNHTITAGISTIDLEMLIRFRFYAGFSFLLGGAGAMVQNYDNVHEWVREDRLTGLQTNNSEVMPSSSAIKTSLITGLSYQFSLDEADKWYIIPEVSYCFGYAGLNDNLKLDANSLRLGLILKFSPGKSEVLRKKEPESPRVNIIQPEPEKRQPEKKVETVKKKSNVNPVVYPVRIDKGREQTIQSIKIEEFVSTNMPPLLNYVFFDHNSDAIPGRYLKLDESEAQAFNIDNLHHSSTLEVYYNILNIIGRRMTEYPNARITLTGCNSDTAEEKGNLKLSEARARHISDYLTSVWKINPKRIKVTARNLPEKPSNSLVHDGNEENRRVEISSNMWEVTAPVVTNLTLVEPDPGEIRFIGKLQDPGSVKSWKLEISQGDRLLETITGDGSFPDYAAWEPGRKRNTMPEGGVPVAYTLTLTDNDGGSTSSKTAYLEVRKVTIKEKTLNKAGDKRIDKYSLILFDFDKSTLNDANKRIINFINDRLEKNSEVLVEGYTDRTGEEVYNQNLSAARAGSVKASLKAASAESRAYGESKLQFDNDLPEGRFYCRTVDVRVETPVK